MAYTTVDDASAYFQVKDWTGNASSQAVTLDGNSNMQPDLYWHKEPLDANGWHIVDSSRGTNKILSTSSNAAQSTWTGVLTSFDSNGFTVPTGDTSTNSNNTPQLSWLWKANGGSTTSVSESGSGNGGINACTYQANDTAGFSIIKYTGHRGSGIGDNNHTNVTHGLSTAPTFVVIKNLQTGHTLHWIIGGNKLAQYGGSFANRHLKFNVTDARDGGDYVFNVAPDSNYVYVGNNNDVNADGHEFIMYAWHDVPGFSKFGIYEGNGQYDGAFIYTGFKPATIISKGIDSTEPWFLFNNVRDPYNPTDHKMSPGSDGAENLVSGQGDINYNMIDVISNGFKCRSNSGGMNGNGLTHMYAAWAENPFVTSGGVAGTAK